MPSDVLAQHGLIDTVAARFISQNLDKLGGTIGKARLDKASEKETPVPYLHHNLQGLEESADTCVFCAMIWERLTIEGFLYDSTILDEMKKKDLVGIPVIQSKVAFTGILSFTIVFVSWSGHNWEGVTYHRFSLFQAISKSISSILFERPNNFRRWGQRQQGDMETRVRPATVTFANTPLAGIINHDFKPPSSVAYEASSLSAIVKSGRQP